MPLKPAANLVTGHGSSSTEMITAGADRQQILHSAGYVAGLSISNSTHARNITGKSTPDKKSATVPVEDPDAA
jgi:hypothetical protein